MFKITGKRVLAPAVKQFEIEAPEIAKRAKAGQFVMLRLNEKGERIPLTLARGDTASGTIRIIVQEIGKTTHALGSMEPGNCVLDVVGPLGCPTEIANFGTVVAVSGGVGTAEVLPVVRALKDAGNKIIGIVGARTRELLILVDEMERSCDRLLVTTDDGSAGQKGFVSNVLEDLIRKQAHSEAPPASRLAGCNDAASRNIPASPSRLKPGDSMSQGIDLVYAIGPVPMMKAISALTKNHNIRTTVSLNPIMVDGTGMCGSCRVTVAGQTKFACVDGPEFDGHTVNWDELISRLSLFRKEEKISLDKHVAECQCKKEQK